jgi:hypothetical protein
MHHPEGAAHVWPPIRRMRRMNSRPPIWPVCPERSTSTVRFVVHLRGEDLKKALALEGVDRPRGVAAEPSTFGERVLLTQRRAIAVSLARRAPGSW